MIELPLGFQQLRFCTFVETHCKFQKNELYEMLCELNSTENLRSHEPIAVETNQLLDSNPNVILMRQTCGLLLSMAVGSKRRALEFYFSVQFALCS